MTAVDGEPVLSRWRWTSAFKAERKAGQDQLGPLEAPVQAELDPIVKSSAVRVHREAFQRLDAEAQGQERSFRRELTIANVCLMFAGVLSGLVLTTVPLWSDDPVTEATGPEAWTRWLPRALGIATLVLGAVAALYTYKAREGNRLQRWLGARSGAELARSSMYLAIAEQVASRPGNLAGEAFKLINQELLEGQRRWYRRRASEHRRSSEWTTVWGGLATALSFIGGSGAVIASFEPSQTWIVLCGVIGAAFGAYAVNRESLRLDKANAEGYEKTAAALDAIASRYDAVEAEINAGRGDAVSAFTRAIAEQLSAEHKRWLEASTQAQSILRKLDAQLETIAGQSKPSPAGNGPDAAVRGPDGTPGEAGRPAQII
jgi:uncharacterized membrane protein HdeD (DUF308 family)